MVTGTASAGYYSGAQMSWSYDPFGNRKSESVGGTVSAPMPSSTTASYTAASNQVSSVNNGAGLVYDAAGNVTQDPLNSYLYDAEGRLCAARTAGPSYTGYIYDAAGTRVAKGSLTSFSCNFAANGFTLTTSWVLGPGGEQVTEYAVSGGTSNWQHTNAFAGGKLQVTYHDTGTYFYLGDWLGTKRVEVGASGCASAYASLPYGNGLTTVTLPGYSQCVDATEHHFTGKERDNESGNDYFGARYYSSAMGRFMSPDWNESPVTIPYADLSNPQTLNLYAYLSNNPLNRTDSTGHAGKSGPIQLGGQTTMRVDTGGADQVNVHVFSKNGEYRGRLNPDTRTIEWTKGTPPKSIAEDAQAYCLSKGKYDIAMVKRGMSVLGGGRGVEEGEVGGSRLMEAGSWLITALQLVDVLVNTEINREINKMEGTTGFHLNMYGQMVVTNLDKFGDTFGVGAGVSVNGDVFRLNGDGTWTDANGAQLYQDKSGMHIRQPTA